MSTVDENQTLYYLSHWKIDTLNYQWQKGIKKRNQNVELESLLFMLCVAKINCLLTYFYIHHTFIHTPPFSSQIKIKHSLYAV